MSLKAIISNLNGCVLLAVFKRPQHGFKIRIMLHSDYNACEEKTVSNESRDIGIFNVWKHNYKEHVENSQLMHVHLLYFSA